MSSLHKLSKSTPDEPSSRSGRGVPVRGARRANDSAAHYRARRHDFSAAAHAGAARAAGVRAAAVLRARPGGRRDGADPRPAMDRRGAGARPHDGHDRRRCLCAAGRGDDGDQRVAGGRAPCRGARRAPAAGGRPARSRKSSRPPRNLRRPMRRSRRPASCACRSRSRALRRRALFWSGSISAVAALNQLIMILFLTYFILLSDKMFRRKFVELAGPTLSKKKITVEIIDSISSQIGRFHRRADLHERRRRRGDVGRARYARASSRRRCGGCWRASSIPFRTTDR